MIDFTGCKVLVNSYEGADFKRRRRMDGKTEYREKTTPQNRSCGVLNVTHVPDDLCRMMPPRIIGSQRVRRETGSSRHHTSEISPSSPLPSRCARVRHATEDAPATAMSGARPMPPVLS